MAPGLKTAETSINSGWEEIISLGDMIGFCGERINIKEQQI
jgi:hypothetical protein|tara:strand:- start:503 stop:625 length:123 start_codon:yes stop_codon:yes gene_type:complete